MNKLASIALALTALLASQMAMSATKVAADASPPVRAAPTKPDAPLHGEIASVDPKAGVIVIGRQKLTIGPPLLALLDQRPHATGLLDLAALQPGMQVRYRTVSEGQAMRIVELWVMRDAPKAE